MCLTYPVNYPKNHILVELKSKNLARKLLDGLEKVAENEAKKKVNAPHVLPILKLIGQFLDDNPLACCSEEISNVKQMLGEDGKLKLSQKTSSMTLHVTKSQYSFKCKVKVPNDYPNERVTIEDVETNFPRVFKLWFAEQAKEIARRCVEPPILKNRKGNERPFEPKPSLEATVGFLVENVQRYPHEICQICKQRAFPEDPSKAIHHPHAAAHVERVYCSHVYHHDCLILYMKTPPFENGKQCPACKNRIYHEKWKVTPQLAEARWAHEQARERELGEVVEFFGDLATTSS